MGIFDKAKDEGENLAQQNPNMTDEALNKSGQEANQATGDRFENQVDQGMQAAQNRIGQQAQGGYDQNQGQDQGQDQVGMGQDQGGMDQGNMGQQDQGGMSQDQGDMDQDQGQGGQGS